MLEIRSILCPIDFSEFSVMAYRHAVSLAEHYRAKLVAQHVIELWRHPSASFSPSASIYDEYCQALCVKGRDELKKFVKDHAQSEVEPQLVVDDGVASDAILSFAQKEKSDLIVMGTHGSRGFDRLIMGSATERVMRKAPCPVLAVREPPHGAVVAGQPRHLDRILTCMDFSEYSERDLKYAFSITAEYDAELTLLHVLEDAPRPAKREEVIDATTKQLDKSIPPEWRKTLKIKTAVRIGKPYQQIIQFAEQAHSDVVTMGVRGRGALDVAVFGSTTYRVMQLGPCPVLAVRV
jgi:nucleotide-binding universal stress UspA family protein